MLSTFEDHFQVFEQFALICSLALGVRSQQFSTEHFEFPIFCSFPSKFVQQMRLRLNLRIHRCHIQKLSNDFFFKGNKYQLTTTAI